jgi:hypothetical protein
VKSTSRNWYFTFEDILDKYLLYRVIKLNPFPNWTISRSPHIFEHFLIFPHQHWFPLILYQPNSNSLILSPLSVSSISLYNYQKVFDKLKIYKFILSINIYFYRWESNQLNRSRTPSRSLLMQSLLIRTWSSIKQNRKYLKTISSLNR